MTENEFNDELEKFSYALGLTISSNLVQSGVTTIEPGNFMKALEDIFTGKEPRLTPDEANRILQEFMEKQQGSQGKQIDGKQGDLHLTQPIRRDHS